MEKFNDLKYERPNLSKYESDVKKLFKDFENLALDEKIKTVEEYFKISDKLSSIIELAQIRATINRLDKFYKDEEDFLNENLPKLGVVDEMVNNYLIKSKDRNLLEEHFGKLLFTKIEKQIKTFSEKIIPYMQEENKLVTKYEQILSGAQINFNNEVLNLTQFGKYVTSTDRNIRKSANEAIWKFFEDNKDNINTIYDEMVKVRNKMALELGYDNYCQMSYDILQRIGYDQNDIKCYREQIKKSVKKLAKYFKGLQEKELRIANLKYYDTVMNFKNGNPKPCGNSAELLDIAKNMYNEMSKETSDFFNMMIERDLLDLDAKKGKQGGGYCTYLPYFNAPFIFSNFNGTSADVDVLTHETGHAFQVYQSKDNISPYRWPSMEGAEVFSMSMEFFAWPWMKNFFKGDYKKYLFMHLKDAIMFLPYGALIDHFQEKVYENPNLTQDERNKLFRELEKEYLPYKNYDGNKFLEDGMFYFRQGHVFASPFYYIDYTLAQVIAFQFLNLDTINHEKAWEKYLGMCKIGGSKSFVDLIEDAGLINPFKDGSIKKILKPLVLQIKKLAKDLF